MNEAPELPASGYSLRAVFKKSFIYTSSDLLLKVIGFFLVPLYTRALSPAEYGIIGFTASVTQILSPFVGLGMVSTLPILFFSNKGDEQKRLIGTMVNATFTYGLLFTLLASFSGGGIFRAINDSSKA